MLPEVSGKPELIAGNKQLLLPGMGGLTEQHMINTRNRSWSVTAQVEIEDDRAEGVILNVGGHAGGWSFYLKDRKPTFCYNLFGIDRTIIRAQGAVPAGKHQLRMEFTYDGEGHGKGGTVTLYLDGTNVGEGRLEQTEPIGYGAVYTNVGRASLSPVTDDYTPGETDFTGTIKWIELESGDDSHDHLIDPEDVFRFAMAKQ